MKNYIKSIVSSILIISVLLVSVAPLSVSAESLVLGEVPFTTRSQYLNSDGSPKGDKWFVYKDRQFYNVLMFPLDDVSPNYIDVGSYESWFMRDTQNSLTVKYGFLKFSASDLTFYNSNLYSGGSYKFSIGYSSSDGYSLESFVNNIIFSSVPVLYNGSEIYNPSQNQDFEITDFYKTHLKPDLPETTLTGMYLDRDTETWSAFLKWLVDTGAVNDLAKFGISNGVSNLSTVADVWWNNKFSPTLVFELLKNNGLRTVQYAKDLISWFNKKWSEFQNSKYASIAYGTPGKVDPHHRAGLIDDEVDENGNIIDDTNTSLLREILRQITLLPSYFYNMFAGVIDNIANNIYALCNYASAMPEKIADSIYNNFIDPINEIKNSIENISLNGGDSITNNNVNVNIDIDNIDQTENNYNIAFGDLQLTLENKFNFYHQITNITDTIQNYSYSDTAPVFQMSVGSELGVTDSDLKIDFSLFDPYREMFRRIIVTVAYISFAINLLHKSPQIIGGI